MCMCIENQFNVLLKIFDFTVINKYLSKITCKSMHRIETSIIKFKMILILIKYK
jgi:hypothetical protein